MGFFKSKDEKIEQHMANLRVEHTKCLNEISSLQELDANIAPPEAFETVKKRFLQSFDMAMIFSMNTLYNDPNHFEAYKRRIELILLKWTVFQSNRDKKKLLKEVNKFVDRHSTNPKTYQLLSDVYKSLGYLEKAEEAESKAKQLRE